MARRSRRWTGPAIDRLEARRTPSRAAGMLVGANPPADVPVFARPELSTTPADGSTFRAEDAPSLLTIHLGGPAGALWFDNGIELRRVADDGSETVVVAANGWGRADLGGSTATLAFPSKLDAGRYRVVLVGGSVMALTYSQGRWDPALDRLIAEFEVEPEPAAVATDLGVVGPNLRVASGNLDGPGAGADSYRIHLDEGAALWRLALQVDADRIGSGLSAGLAVYDSTGARVAAATVGAAVSSDFPDDPYLFVGLAPGDYVVVVSKGEGAPGGAYRLNLTAAPATAATRVSSFAIERTGPSASGFTITFSSPIDPARLRSDAVHVVDAAGGIHAVRLESVTPGLTGASFRFVSPLPAGAYRLEVAGERPLADLIGRVPVAAGLPAGTLASWTVSASEAGEPTPADVVASGPLDLAPGAATEIPITLGAGESLALIAKVGGGRLRIELLGGPDGPLVVASGEEGGSREAWIRPGPGSYVIRLVSVGDDPLVGGWNLARATVPEESLVARAVGSGGMIGLALGETPPAASAPGAADQGSPRIGRTSDPAVAAGRGEMGPSPRAWSGGSAPIGRPSPTADAVAPVGPETPGGPTSVAWAGDPGSPSWRSLVLSERLADGPAPRAETTRDDDAAPARDERVARAAAEDVADDNALERAERVAEALLGRLRWLFERPTEEADAPAEAGEAVARAGAESVALGGGDGSDGVVQRSALDLPFAVLFVTASTFHLRRATRRWWKTRRAVPEPAARERPSPPKPLFRGPRLMAPDQAAIRAAGPRRG